MSRAVGSFVPGSAATFCQPPWPGIIEPAMPGKALAMRSAMARGILSPVSAPFR